MSTLWRRISVATFCAAAYVLTPAAGAALAATLPQVPKVVTELYLPEEQEACRSAYAIYVNLGDGLLAKLHAGTKYPIASAKLSPFTRTKLAAWFNSARWGCDPPADRLDAEAVAKATLVLTHTDGVVELALQSPEQGIWKKLTIACTPEKVGWVRDGLPLLPHWMYSTWTGGHYPPRPREDQWGLNRLHYEGVQGTYGMYALLSPTSLRVLHETHRLELRFRDLPDDQRRGIVRAVDNSRFRENKSRAMPLDRHRSQELVKSQFLITRVVLEYRNSHPNLPYPFETDLVYCPRSYRQVFLTVDAANEAGVKALPEAPGETFAVALPAELQRVVMAWLRETDAWTAKWRYKKDGKTYQRPEAPPFPQFHAGD